MFEQIGDLRAAAFLRMALGPITVLHLWPFLSDARAGVYYDEHFWHPFASWAPRPSGELWAALLWVGVGSAVMMSVGVLSRLTTATTFAVVAGNLLLSETHFRHNRAFLTILLGGLTLLPTGAVLSFDSWSRRRRGRPRASPIALIWPLLLLRVQVSLVYLASGLSKLVDPDWVSGLVLWDRVVRYQHVLDQAPGWLVDVLTWRPLYFVVAPAAVLTELFLAVGLWSAPCRLAAIRVAILFHLAIEISAEVEVFSYAAIAALVIWVTPAARDRTVRLDAGSARARRLVWALHWLDWLGRFRVEAARPDEPDVVVVDRHGATVADLAGVRLILSRLPATFLLAPLVRR
jgi:hypothetical protein